MSKECQQKGCGIGMSGNFCSACGSKLVEVGYVCICGEEGRLIGQNFCRNCGLEIPKKEIKDEPSQPSF